MFTQLCLEHTKNENKQLKYTILYIKKKKQKHFYIEVISRDYYKYWEQHTAIYTWAFVCNDDIQTPIIFQNSNPKRSVT